MISVRSHVEVKEITVLKKLAVYGLSKASNFTLRLITDAIGFYKNALK